MKRLILIGNGFDLHHGHKTSYNDFIEYYLCNALNIYIKGGFFDDNLIRIGSEDIIHFDKEDVTKLERAFEIIESLKKKRDIIDFKSDLFNEIIFKVKTNKWVDIENQYFSYLRRYKSASNNNLDGIKKINDDFDYLKDIFENYITYTTKVHIPASSNKLLNLFCQEIKVDEIALTDKEIKEDQKPKELYFVNFNYTRTLESHFDIINKQIPSTINYIHGELNSKENPIIFGFGDEHDKHYLGFEDEQNDELFRHIKSFKYSKTSNYHNLIKFVNSEEFQVFIIGHSCGLSDRTMLKEIFEHDKCKSIKIFYYAKSSTENDFTEKTYDISRHFSDKGLMRKKIVPFDKSKSLDS
ncbi:AbiH family protein [Flavobacterium sp.]|uniref:AbiH family protein n=1 Tax=Flavobacterium sp. TaxID=239 RepID=UPI00374CE451